MDTLLFHSKYNSASGKSTKTSAQSCKKINLKRSYKYMLSDMW